MTVTVKGLPPTEQQKIALREAFGVVGYETNPLTGGVKKYSPEVHAADPLANPSTLEFLIPDPAQTWGKSNLTNEYDSSVKRFHNGTMRLDITANSAVFFKGTRTIKSPVSRIIAVDVYIPFPVKAGAGAPAINVSMSNNNNLASDRHVYTFNANYLRQGWNTLRMWEGESAATAPRGCTLTKYGAGVDFGVDIQYIEFQWQNMNGRSVYLDSVRRAAKVKSALVIGFDASGTDIMSAAKIMDAYKAAGYFTVTNIYDLENEGGQTRTNRHDLMHRHGWDALPHTWNHGATKPGATYSVTLSRTSNIVTATWPAAHAFTVGEKFHAGVYGASPADMNGSFEVTVASTTTVTYAADGANGSGAGTIVLSTKLEDVINADTPILEDICRHEIADNVTACKATGYARNAKIIAYPNNSVPFLPVLQRVCKESGVVLGRSIAAGTVKFNEFGVDNPLNFGSVELGSSGEALASTTAVYDQIRGAVSRGEDIWLYGHYVLDESSPENAGHANANMEYPPGIGGNPLPPQLSVDGGYGGWWYAGQVRLLLEMCAHSVASGDVTLMSPTEWARARGYDVNF